MPINLSKGKFLKMALALQGITADEFLCERIFATVEKLQKKGGEFDVHDAVSLEYEFNQKRIEIRAEKE